MEYSFAGPDTVAWRVHYDLLKSLVADIKRHIPTSGSRTIISILTLLYCMMCYAWEYMFLGVGWLSNGCLVPFTGHSRGVFTIWSREAGNSYTEFLIMHIHWIAIWAWKTKRHWSNYNVNQKTSTQGTVTETFWSLFFWMNPSHIKLKIDQHKLIFRGFLVIATQHKCEHHDHSLCFFKNRLKKSRLIPYFLFPPKRNPVSVTSISHTGTKKSTL